MSDQQQIDALVHGCHPCLSIVTGEEPYALALLLGAAMASARKPLVWSAAIGLRDGLFDDSPAMPDTRHAAAALQLVLDRVREPAILIMLDLSAHLEDPVTLRLLREVIHRFSATRQVLALVDHRDGLPPIIAAEAARVETSLPEEQELEQIVRATVKRMHEHRPVTTRLRSRDLEAIVRNLRGLTRAQASRIIAACLGEDQCLDADDLPKVMEHKRRLLRHDGLLEPVDAPVSMDQVGGLDNLKRWLELRRNAFSERAAKFGITPPRGVLLLGVQGAGKSLAAKAVATAWQRPLLRLDPSVLYDRYIGESERRLRLALRQAEMSAPIVLWVDEIEKGFASAASHSVDGGLSQRMFGTLLTWMQEHDAPVFLIATANNVEALPPELLRKGRFDEIFFVDLPQQAARKQILDIHLKRRGRDVASIDLDSLAAQCEGFSGAELEQAVISGLHAAFAESRELETADIARAIATSPPLSVTAAEQVEALRAWAEGRCMPAD